MPSAHLSLHCHLIFSTKDRRPLIGKDWRGRLHAFLGGAVKDSSRWVDETLPEQQEGCGGFTASPSRIARVERYIERQEGHHRKISFKEECLELLQRSGVEYDERFLW